MALEVGARAPEFRLQDAEGREVALSEMLGERAVVLFFFPRADTPG